ncbi:MAG TPA: glycosyl hydrolase family 28-related protein [Bryobacteraceae bacterium]|nr:glycosyl hydrolase family 28-related protein [Bryobacteraceae bacterium]
MKSIRLLLFLVPLLSVAQTKTDFNSQLNNLPFVSVMAEPFSATGDCVTDDTNALQAALNTNRFIWLPKPPGGCYLVSKTLILQPGDYLYGASANNPNPGDPNQGVVIRLAPNSNVSLLQTFDSQDAAGGGNEFMAVENIVFDGNGANQTQELQNQALVDYRGTFIQTFLRHVLITNAFGPGLFTGSTELDNVWIIACSTSTYSWIHNPGASGLGALLANQVYVEDQITPFNGQYRSPWDGSVNDPSTYAHAIWFNGMGNATINQLHCESATTCIDFNDIQSLTIHGISGTRIGNPTSSDPTDQYLIRALNLNANNLTFSAAYFDQSGTTYTGTFSNSRVFGLGNNLVSNDLFQTPVGQITWPFYTWGRYDQSYTGVPYLGERSIASNELWIQQVGTYSPNRLAIFDNTGGPGGSYAYFERNGSELNLGFSPGPWDANEVTMLQMNFFGLGNSGNNVQVPGGRIQTGVQTNTDMNGELTLNAATSATYNFAGYYLVHPECTATPQFDIGSGNRFWLTYSSNTALTVNFAQNVTGNVSYVCLGRN